MGHEAAGAPAPHAAPEKGTTVVYRGATLVDGTGGPARPSMTIAVDGARIVLVAPDGEIPGTLLDGAETVDLRGRFVIPGLIDSHQHIATPPNRAPAEETLRRQVYGGVTAIRDMADDLRQVGDLARATLVGEIPGPDIHYAALMAGPGFFDDPRTWQVSQGETPGAVPWMQAVTEETDLPLAVAMARGTHARAIKIYADLPASLVAAITAEAHRQGIAVWAHGTVFPSRPSEVVAAGVDSVSHITLLAYEGGAEPLNGYKDKPAIEYDRFAAGDDPALQALFERMLEHRTVLDATAGLWEWIGAEAEDDGERARARANSALAARLTAHAHRAGVPISTGTDYETEPHHPFPALHDEMAFLAEHCGMSTAEVIRSATLVGAMSLGAETDMGTVESGKLANFVVLAEDPLADLAHLRSIVLTVKRGRGFERTDYRPAGEPAGAEPKGCAG
ncbi:amidohydrolase family protein [Streptacidiphilus griseoplanus]|uniref:amidohydrolase family protein n=1 Tax=Peterkaempfera griseoplana TaxID=66896 RepID=UPI0006E37F28|nr:amidohydrolase family protein [Peterkaempfera griseoplana]